MTAKEKAEELIRKFKFESLASHSDSIKCAIVVVDELLEEVYQSGDIGRHDYWLEVKQELTNL